MCESIASFKNVYRRIDNYVQGFILKHRCQNLCTQRSILAEIKTKENYFNLKVYLKQFRR